MRFASVSMFMDFGEWGFRMGRPVANEGFLRALLTHGSYDTYEFFCPDIYHMERFSQNVDQMIEDPALRARVKVTLQLALAESVAGTHYDVFHLGDFTSLMPYLLGVRNRYSEPPFPVTGVTHSLDGVFMNLRYLELLLQGMAPFDAIICTSRSAQDAVSKGFSWIKEEMERRWNVSFTADPQLIHIPLGIDDDFFEHTDKNAAKNFFRIPAEKVVALSVGRLSARLKTDWTPVLGLLARMVASNNFDNFLFIIAGGGDDSDIRLLQEVIAQFGLQEKVLVFANFLPEVKSTLYQAADFYLSPVDNFQETFGLNILEAMASGLPIIASDFSGYRELVSQEVNGFLLKTVWPKNLPECVLGNLGILHESMARLYFSQALAVDLGELEQALTTLYRDHVLRLEMGAASLEQAQAYRWPHIIRCYEEAWAELAATSRKIVPFASRKDPDLLLGNPTYTLSHYPSKTLEDSDLVFLTPFGLAVLDENIEIMKYADAAVSMFPELHSLILEELGSGSEPVSHIKEAAQRRLEATEAQTEYHLLWLMKQGAVSLKENGATQ
ncbi:MAG: glycosyltransferase family 4 protein [Deltaproteobacteria bacterium]|nr:glycosyltransferase family 4 protein [Deltaproteobacteria bacterium]MBW2071765.1 glycosyltransferase family 4 protein [Deltaproteobacteria bacterium]